MKAKIQELQKASIAEIARVDGLKALEECRVRWLGRKGAVTEVLRGLSQATAEERPALGKAANELKLAIRQAIDDRHDELEKADGGQDGAKGERIDFSLPGRRPPRGHLHLVSQVANEMVDIFTELGFQVATGPDIETEYYNFDSLNTPADHPARDVHDTFFIKPGVVLRTHTSPVQMRIMEKTPPPVAIVVPGRVYRIDNDASHSPMFYQLEGLLVDERISFADLKGTLVHFIHRLFGPNTKLRFRPHFFPFTEPSAEVDISCSVCKGSGCRLCKNSGWVEILGCGMVHPEVFRYANYDYEQYTGFAFGMGVERIALLKHRVNSIQHLYENDLRFLEQF